MLGICCMSSHRFSVSCLRRVESLACSRHPHAILLNEALDADWLLVLRQQRQRRLRQRGFTVLAGLSLIGLTIAPLPSVLLLHLFSALLLWERKHASLAGPAVLLQATEKQLPLAASTSDWMQRRNRRVERLNLRERASFSRVHGAG